MTTHPDLYNEHPSTVVMYFTTWCPDCRRARRVLESEQVAFLGVDIDLDARAEQFVKSLNRGNRSVPTIIFPDGSRMVEPDNEQLTQKLQQFQTR